MTEVSANASNPTIGPIRRWVLGARPRTLTAAIMPVAVGTAVGRVSGGGGIIWWRALCAAVVALAIQVGANYANDYSDGVRGSDAVRVGPLRLTASGLVPASSVKRAAFISFGVAAGAGIALAAAVGWWLLGVGLACFVAGWLYTGGPKPYGYLGFGEIFVLVFFGFVATAGSAYVQHGQLGALAFSASVPVGLLAVALLESNNLRDVVGDAAVSKRTVAVRLGASRAKWLYVGVLIVGVASAGLVAWWRPGAAVALAAAIFAWRPISVVTAGAEGASLLPVLAATGRLQLIMGALLTFGILW